MLQQLREFQQNYINTLDAKYKRSFFEKVDFTNKLIGIVGARGVGKTTFLLQYLQECTLSWEKKLYCSADSLDVESLFDIAYRFYQEGGELLIIDEIHKYRGFEKELKKIYDMLGLRVIFSGSSALKLDHAKADLSRRVVMYHMNGLSFREFIELREGISLPAFTFEEIVQEHIDIATTICTKIKPFEHWQEYLQSGFYPFYFDNKNSYALKLQETINTVIEVDIPSIFTIEYDKVIRLKKLVRLICSSKPFQVNIKALSQNIGVRDYQTIYRYLEYLQRGKILNILKQRANDDTIFSKPDKLYLGNTNLHYSYCQEYEIGTIREVFFYSMFAQKRLSYTKKGDFMVDDRFIFEIGGKNKGFQQIKDIDASYVAADAITVGSGNKIPLWLFGFMY
ncbi:MAG: ATP-binding protein [Campylobacterota bacterium]